MGRAGLRRLPRPWTTPGTPTYHDFAKRQIDYALGDNPGKHSYVVGFGTNPPTHVHHRAASGQSLGYMSDTDRPEPAHHLRRARRRPGRVRRLGGRPERLPTQRGRHRLQRRFHRGAGSAGQGVRRNPGGERTTGRPGARRRDLPSSQRSTTPALTAPTIAIAITNKSGWPPRILTKAKARYYFTLDGSTTASQLKVSAQDTSGCAASGPYQYSGSTYYAEIDCTGKAIYPGDSQAYQRTTGLTISATSPGTWDATNDWSAQAAKNITLYDDSGALVFGTAPSGTGPSATPSSSVSASPSASSSVSPTTSPTTSGAAASCAVNYAVGNAWSGGASINVTVTNKTATPVAGWTLRWTFPGNQQLAGSWNATVTQSGAVVTASNPASAWNGTLAANGGSAAFGFNLTFSGANQTPTDFTLNGAACA